MSRAGASSVGRVEGPEAEAEEEVEEEGRWGRKAGPAAEEGFAAAEAAAKAGAAVDDDNREAPPAAPPAPPLGVEEAETGALVEEGVANDAALAEARFFREPERESSVVTAAAAEGVEAPLPPLPPMPVPVAVKNPALGVAAAELPALPPVEREEDARPVIEAGRPLSVETSRRGSGGRED